MERSTGEVRNILRKIKPETRSRRGRVRHCVFPCLEIGIKIIIFSYGLMNQLENMVIWGVSNLFPIL